MSRGFKGRRRPPVELPPGQDLVEDFPVLSAGPTPSIEELEDWGAGHHHPNYGDPWQEQRFWGD